MQIYKKETTWRKLKRCLIPAHIRISARNLHLLRMTYLLLQWQPCHIFHWLQCISCHLVGKLQTSTSMSCVHSIAVGLYNRKEWSFHTSAFNWHVINVARLIEALRSEPEVRRFSSRWCYWNFSLTQSLRTHYGTGVDHASKWNEYHWTNNISHS
jgi:hypothetical protein